MEERANRKAAVALHKAGLATWDVAKVLGISDNSIRREWEYDPGFYQECLAAMEDPFEPVLRRAIELSESADVAGENEGAHKALAQVLNFYSKALDRRQKYELTARAIDDAAKSTGQGGGSLVLGPAGVREVIRHLEGKSKTDAIETTGEKK